MSQMETDKKEKPRRQSLLSRSSRCKMRVRLIKKKNLSVNVGVSSILLDKITTRTYVFSH